MGFQVDNIPYALNVGVDLSLYDLNQTELTDQIFKLEENKLDYIVYNIFVLYTTLVDCLF